jgi:DNA processing protein
MSGRLQPSLDEATQLDWLHLARIEGLGPRGFAALHRQFEAPAAMLRAIAGHQAGLKQRLVLPPRSEIEGEFRRLKQAGIHILALPDLAYPAALRAIDDPPPVLTVKGNLALLARPAVALVGARNASALGRKMAAQLAAGLGAAGLTIVSGLARGIDTEVHRASLATGTMAVLAGGLARPYPPENEALFDEIGRNGLVISEMRLELSPRGQDFPRRNRLIAGLSLGVVVVEAARRSGSLITARLAAEQGRDVMAVPGSPLDPRCEGSNDLLRDGASFVTSVADVLAVLPRQIPPQSPNPPGLREEAAVPSLWLDGADEVTNGSAGTDADLLDLLPFEGIDIDELGRIAAMAPAVMAERLFDLELAGMIERLPGNRVARCLTSAWPAGTAM